MDTAKTSEFLAFERTDHKSVKIRCNQSLKVFDSVGDQQESKDIESVPGMLSCSRRLFVKARRISERGSCRGFLPQTRVLANWEGLGEDTQVWIGIEAEYGRSLKVLTKDRYGRARRLQEKWEKKRLSRGEHPMVQRYWTAAASDRLSDLTLNKTSRQPGGWQLRNHDPFEAQIHPSGLLPSSLCRLP